MNELVPPPKSNQQNNKGIDIEIISTEDIGDHSPDNRAAAAKNIDVQIIDEPPLTQEEWDDYLFRVVSDPHKNTWPVRVGSTDVPQYQYDFILLQVPALRHDGLSGRQIYTQLLKWYHPDLHMHSHPTVKAALTEFSKALNAMNEAGLIR